MPNPNMSSRFRAALKQEIPLWLREGVLTPEGAQRLGASYRLSELEREGSRLLAGIIFGIGGLFLGGAALAFVAANWAAMGASLKVVVLFLGLLACHGAGCTLWRYREWPRLGHAFVFLGCLVMGGGIGLMAQIFHIHEAWARGFGAWAAGCIAMAWAVESFPIGLLALVVGDVWFNGELFGDGGLAWLFLLLVAVLIVPLALRTGSRLLHSLGLLAMVNAFAGLAWDAGRGPLPVLAALTASAFLAWAWGEVVGVLPWRSAMSAAARVTGVVALSLTAYFYSFRWIWREHFFSERGLHPAAAWGFCAGLPLLAGLALIVYAWGRSKPGEGLWARLSVIGAVGLLGLSAAAGLALAYPASAPAYGSSGLLSDRMWLPVLLVNLAAFLLALSAVLSGLSAERRGRFWGGATLGVLLVLSRFLEYQTSLLLKALAFLACGVLVMWGGILFERRLRRVEAARA